MLRRLATIFLIIIPLSGCQLFQSTARQLSQFQPSQLQTCYNRDTQPHSFVVDSHVHFRPYGNNPLDYQKLLSFFKPAGVLFVNVYGIGQTLPDQNDCLYPADCPTTPVTPSIANDIINIENSLQHPSNQIQLIHAMTFADLSQPQTIMPQIKQLQQKYHNQFRWMGELNLVKQGLFSHGHKPIDKAAINQWQPFMTQLRLDNIPIALHADIGNDDDLTAYLSIFDHVLATYPDNKIVWLHLGISPEQNKISPQLHLKLLQQRLDNHPNLYLDISWRILNKKYNSSAKSKQLYVDFFNRNYRRILTGSDFVSTDKSTIKHYKNSVAANSEILEFIDNRAFRSIVLGQNYFDLLRLNYQAPQVCER